MMEFLAIILHLQLDLFMSGMMDPLVMGMAMMAAAANSGPPPQAPFHFSSYTKSDNGIL